MVMLSYADKQVLGSMFPLFLASLNLRPELRHIQESLIVVVPTSEDLDFCMRLHSTCHLDYHAEIPLVEVPENIETAHWQGMKTARASWRRVDYVNHILSMDIGVIMMDLDMLVLGNPFSLLRDPEYSDQDVFAQADGRTYDETVLSGLLNMGFCYFRPTQATKDLVAIWTLGRTRWDQGYLQQLLREKTVPHLQWKPVAYNLTYNLCHVSVGTSTEYVPNKDELSPNIFYPEFFQYLVRNKDHMRYLLTFHTNCCNQFPTVFSCKSMLLHLALDAVLESEKA